MTVATLDFFLPDHPYLNYYYYYFYYYYFYYYFYYYSPQPCPHLLH